MGAAGLFRYAVQCRFVGFRKSGGDRAVRSEDRFDETGSLRPCILDAAVRSETAHDIRGIFIDGTGESF